MDGLLALCRGDAALLTPWFRADPRWEIGRCVLAILVGCGLYGFALGSWRAPLMGAFVAIKLPALIFLTVTINGALNSIVAQGLGSGLKVGQVVLGCLMSFTTFSVVLGSLAPVLYFLVLTAPPVDHPQAASFHATLLIANALAFVAAGVASNRRLLDTLTQVTGHRAIARRVVFAWLAGNLFVGAQVSWILRPFLGNPELEVAFLRPDPMHGNFYEDVWQKAVLLTTGERDEHRRD